MYQSTFMVEREAQLLREKSLQRQAEQRRLVREATAQPKPRRRRFQISDLYQLTRCTFRAMWRMAC